MNEVGIAGLIRRRGMIVVWHHAIPASGDRVDDLALEPVLTAGGPRKALGPQGETYHKGKRIRAYWQKNVTASFAKTFGVLDQRDSQITLAAKFRPEPWDDIQLLDPELLEAYTCGNFCKLGKPEDFDSVDLVARDKFTINGVTWIVKSQPEPIVDRNAVVAWRLLLGASTY